jgi:hypothetical protein
MAVLFKNEVNINDQYRHINGYNNTNRRSGNNKLTRYNETSVFAGKLKGRHRTPGCEGPQNDPTYTTRGLNAYFLFQGHNRYLLLQKSQ